MQDVFQPGKDTDLDQNVDQRVRRCLHRVRTGDVASLESPQEFDIVRAYYVVGASDATIGAGHDAGKQNLVVAIEEQRLRKGTTQLLHLIHVDACLLDADDVRHIEQALQVVQCEGDTAHRRDIVDDQRQAARSLENV
jgi:hypothetical protein